MSTSFDRVDKVALAGLALLLTALTELLYLCFHGTSEVYDLHEALFPVATDPMQTAYVRGEAGSHLLACYAYVKASTSTVQEVFADCDRAADARITSIECQTSDKHPTWGKVG
jgi:hypothetical protein